jgi:mevalonate kinase
MLEFKNMTSFKAFGKFLITGEYLVLNGARALALPLTKKYQTLDLFEGCENKISWTAFDHENLIWFKCNFDSITMDLLEASSFSQASKLELILKYIKKIKPDAFNGIRAFETHMNFSPAWGMGSSSTLISLLSQWSNLDANHLQKIFFKGSGYDVACATSLFPILYQLENGLPVVECVKWSPKFKDQLYFVYLGKKQNSSNEIEKFRNTSISGIEADLIRINQITKDLLESCSFEIFQNLLKEHETIISKYSGMKPIKSLLFPDIDGEVKSLGAWGGDFILAACKTDPREYFNKKGYLTVFDWDDLID